MKLAKTSLLILSLLIATSTCFAATAYTSRTDFMAAVSGYTVQRQINFDPMANGAYAGYFDKLSDYANGLDSDGTTHAYLSTIATNAFHTSSRSNALGVDVGDHQFLSGNSDSVTFSFTGPVHAFGINLIGNPSPTGDPAIPFWKMTTNIGEGFDALSATEPLYTISSGNDVYFLGIVSPDQPFTLVTLYSDNDPAAVYSFNIDDVVYGTNAKSVSISEAKSEQVGSVVMLTGVPVERVHYGFFGTRVNVESPDRSSGIVILGDAGANRTGTVTFTGTVTTTSDDEVAINLDEVFEIGDNGDPVPSLGMSTLSLGGGVAKGLQIGIPRSVGPNNIGLDITIWGKITAVHNDPNPYAGGSWIIVDDGAGRISGEEDYKGVKVTGQINAAARNVGDFVVVRGSSSLWKSQSSQHYPLVRVAQPDDITPPPVPSFTAVPVGRWLH